MTTQEAIVWVASILAIAGIVIVGIYTGHPEVLALLFFGLLVLFS